MKIFCQRKCQNCLLLIAEIIVQVTGRRDRAKPLPFKLEESGPWGFSGANEGNPRISAEFIAPCYYLNK